MHELQTGAYIKKPVHDEEYLVDMYALHEDSRSALNTHSILSASLLFATAASQSHITLRVLCSHSYIFFCMDEQRRPKRSHGSVHSCVCVLCTLYFLKRERE